MDDQQDFSRSEVRDELSVRAAPHEWHPKDRIAVFLTALALVISSFSSFFSFLSSQASSNSAEAAKMALSFQEKPLLIARCGFPKSTFADYVVPIESSRGGKKSDVNARNHSLIPTNQAFVRDKGRDYLECDFQNLGTYTLLNITTKISSSFSKTDKLGNNNIGPAIVPEAIYGGTMDAIGPKETKTVFIYNDDPCLKATIALEQNVAFLNVPYEKFSIMSFPGWIRGYYGLRPRDIVFDQLVQESSKKRGVTYEKQCRS